MSEYEYLNLFYIFLISNAMYFVGFAPYLVRFRFANAIYQGDAGDNVVERSLQLLTVYWLQRVSQTLDLLLVMYLSHILRQYALLKALHAED